MCFNEATGHYYLHFFKCMQYCLAIGASKKTQQTAIIVQIFN